MHSYLILNLESLQDYQSINGDDCLLTLDYYLYLKLKDAKNNVYFINEFADDGLIESWQSFVGNFLNNLSMYLSDTTLQKERWLNYIDRPLTLYALEDFNIFNVVPRLMSFFSEKSVKSLEIVGSISEVFFSFLDAIALSSDVKITNSYTINTCSQNRLIGHDKSIIKRCLAYISNLKPRKNCIVFPEMNMPAGAMEELIESNFDLAIINPSKKIIRRNITNASFYFTGLKNYSKKDTGLMRIKQIFNQIDFTESFFLLVELSFKKTSDFWLKEKQAMENWIMTKEPAAVIIFDIQEIAPRLLAKIARDRSIPSFHLPHGFYFVKKRQLEFVPLQLTGYIATPNEMVRNYYINELNIASEKIINHKIFQIKNCNADDNPMPDNIVVLEYGRVAHDFFDDYSLFYRLPYDLITALKEICPHEKIIYRERPGDQDKMKSRVREYLEPLYEKGLFTYDENRVICRTFKTARFVIGPFSTAFFEAIACNTPYYCYVPAKLQGVPPLTSDSPFVFSDIKELRDILSKEYPLQSLKDKYFQNLPVTIDQIITKQIKTKLC
jgi:hypothetical protein